MANKKIKSSDIVEPKLLSGVIAEAKELLKAIEGMQVAMKGSIKIQKEFLTVSKVKDFTGYKQQEEAIKKVKTETELLVKAENERKTVENQLVVLQKQEALELAKGKIQLQQRNKALNDLAKTELGLIGAYDKTSKKLNDLRKSYQNLVVLGRENGKVARGMKAEIDKLDKTLKHADASVGKFNRNVGNYSGQMIGAARSSGILGGQLGGLADRLEGAASSLKQAGGGAKGLIKEFGVLAGGAGAGVIAIAAAALGGLALVLFNTEKGMELVAQKTMAAKSVFEVFTESVAKMNFDNFIERAGKAAEAAESYAKGLEMIEDKEIASTVPLAKLSAEIAKNKLAMEDSNATLEQKLKLAKEAIALDEKRTGVKLTKGGLKVGSREVDGSITEYGVAFDKFIEYKMFFDDQENRTDEMRKNLADLEAALINVETEAFVGRKKLAGQVENLEREIEKKREDAQKEKLEKIKDGNESEYQIHKANEERRIYLMEEGFQKEKEALFLRYQDTERNAKKNKEELYLVEKNYLKDLEDLRKKYKKKFKEQKINDEDVTKTDLRRNFKMGVLTDEGGSPEHLANLKRIEDEKKTAELIKQLQKTITDSAIRELEKQYDAKIEFFGKEIDTRKENINKQEELAARGLDNTAAYEKKKLAEAELAQSLAQKQKIRDQKLLAYYSLISAYANSGDKSAAANALVDILTSEAVGLFAWEGAENVGEALGNKGKRHGGRDGYRGRTKSGDVIAFDGGERILSNDQNKLIGDISNDALATMAYNTRMGAEKMDGVNDQNSYALLSEIKKLNETIAKKKEISVSWNSLDERVEQTVQDGMKKTVRYIRQRPRI